MLRLTSSWRPRMGASRLKETGAVATIVALLLGGGVLLGFGALSIDVGNLMWERRQLQNGADAAVLDLAKICGTATAVSTACSTTSAATDAALEQLVDGNANDGTGDLETICAGGPAVPGVTLPACVPPNAAQLANCPSISAKYAAFPYVQAHTRTETSGSSMLPYILAQTITGTAGSTVGACARATWGTPLNASSTAPITISQCEWEHASASGSNYAEPPVYNGSLDDDGYGGTGQPSLPSAKEVVLLTKYSDSSIPNPCKNWHGHDAPGAFSYLGTSTGCNVAAEPPKWIKGEAGNALPCDYTDFSKVLGTVVDIPVHFCMVKVPGSGKPSGDPAVSSTPACGFGSGQNWYYVSGWAKFYISGYKVGGASQADNIYHTPETCGGLSGGGYRCIRGWFTTGVITADTVGPPSGGFGAISVVPAG